MRDRGDGLRHNTFITQLFYPSRHVRKTHIHSTGRICNGVVLVKNQLSGITSLSTQLTTFQTLLKDLNKISTLQAQSSTLSQEGILSATSNGQAANGQSPEALADALIALERNRTREERERQRERFEGRREDQFDLVAAGIEFVWSLLRR